MKGEMINAIAVEIYRHNSLFQEQVVMKELKENGMLFDLYRDYKEKLFPRTGKQEFAAIYSHTVIFVLLGAALFNSNRLNKNGLKKILLKIIQQLTGSDPVILDILKSITTINIQEQLITFILESKDKLTAPGKEDDVLALLYQRFLKRYEPVLHKKIRYYYTPGPVVSFMVHSIHHLLKEKLNINEGLADLDIGIFDPAFGNGNFLAEVIQLAIEERTKKYGEGIVNSFIESYLKSSIHGFEIMLPLYVMGCINLIKIIRSFCRGVQMRHGTVFSKRVPLAAGGNLYLTDTLENQEVSNIPIGVIFCNPPYSRHSLSKGEWIRELVKDYFHVKGMRIQEKNLKGLQDDYVKFFRFAQWKIDQQGSGIIGFITSSSYLENPTFRGMRYSLLKSFDEIYILDLHGVAGKSDKKDGDENVFGVGQGIAIGFFIKLEEKSKKKKNNHDSLNSRVYYSSIKGNKDSKLKQLEKIKEENIKAVQWERVFPSEDFYLFTPGRQVDLYQHFIKVTDIFPVHSVGIVTARDKLTINPIKEEMYTTVSNFVKVDETFAGKMFDLGEDTRDWKVMEAQKDIKESGVDRNKIVPILYRPFDLRYTYYTGKTRGFICMPRPGVMRHMLLDNIGLITVRQVPGGAFNHCFVTDTIIDGRITTSNKGMAYIFPLYQYIYPGKNKKEKNVKLLFPGQSIPRHCNIDPGVFSRLQEYGFLNQPSSVQIFHYIYAILHSVIYRDKYRDLCHIAFRYIP
jgi:predicted helicase